LIQFVQSGGFVAFRRNQILAASEPRSVFDLFFTNLLRLYKNLGSLLAGADTHGSGALQPRYERSGGTAKATLDLMVGELGLCPGHPAKNSRADSYRFVNSPITRDQVNANLQRARCRLWPFGVHKMKLRSNIDFIVYAVRQAKKAEAYGFTRNEACRNLKTALHQYWQNKEMGMHSQAHRERIPLSEAAANRIDEPIQVEHAVPQQVIVDRLMDMRPLTKKRVKELLIRLFRVLRVTKSEHDRLNATGLRSAMPDDWDGINPFARYDAAGIVYPRDLISTKDAGLAYNKPSSRKAWGVGAIIVGLALFAVCIYVFGIGD
jgi:hypothetical protein